jgi:hypothetical protein
MANEQPPQDQADEQLPDDHPTTQAGDDAGGGSEVTTNTRWSPPPALVGAIGVLALIVVIVCIAIPAATGRQSTGMTTALTISFLIGFAVLIPALGPHVRKWRLAGWIATGAGAAVVAAGLYSAWTQNLEPASPPETSPSTSTVTPIVTTGKSTPKAPSETSSPSPPSSITPSIPTSSQSPRTLDRDRVKLRANSSEVIKKFDLRIAAGSVYESYAVVRFSAPDAACNGAPSVGDAMVETSPVDYEGNYDRWYRVVVDRIDGSQVSLEWTVGTGPAPVGSPYLC